MPVTASELTFGIECETVLPPHAGFEPGQHNSGRQVPYLPRGWKGERDCSISGSGCEIVSPVLTGESGIVQIVETMKCLSEKNHATNQTCGVHVHVGWRPEWNGPELDRLIQIVAYLERGLYAITGTKSRENGSFCRSVRQYGSTSRAKSSMQNGRYHLLNITNIQRRRERKYTVEFRVFSGSTSATKIAGWAQVCLGIVQRAVNSTRVPPWNPPALTAAWARQGQALGEVERLLAYLAWGENYRAINGGVQYGWISEAVKQDEIKTEFRRLAQKYEAPEAIRAARPASRPATPRQQPSPPPAVRVVDPAVRVFNLVPELPASGLGSANDRTVLPPAAVCFLTYGQPDRPPGPHHLHGCQTFQRRGIVYDIRNFGGLEFPATMICANTDTGVLHRERDARTPREATLMERGSY